MTTLAEAAVRYAAHGWHVFPLWWPTRTGQDPMCACGDPRCESPAKHPRIASGFKMATTDTAHVREWWSRWPSANIGLAAGRSGLVIIDIDGPEGGASAMMMGFLGVATARVQTGRPEGGQHLYFMHPGFHVSNKALAPHLDVRADAGYVLLPPSIHPTGATYTWSGARTVAELPPQALETLRALQEPEPEPAPSPVPWTPPTSWRDADALNRRVRAYLDTVGQVSEGARNSTAFRVAAWLVRDVALTGDVAWCYLREWNDGNAPPLGTRELRTCLTSAMQHGRRGVGSGLHREAVR